MSRPTSGSGFGTAAYSPPPGAPAPSAGTAAAAAAEATAPVHAPHANPKVAELQTMFPTVDPAVIELVLESVGGSQDRAIEQLLSMTDDNFKPEAGATARREAESQVDLDAAFARSLALQDQEDAQHSSGYGHHAQTGNTNPGAGGELPYQPRVKRTAGGNRPPPPGSANDVIYGAADARAGQYRPAGVDERYQDRPDGQPQGRDGMLAVEQKIEQFAEVGKQTFNSLLSRAKAKYAEYQATQGQDSQNPGYAQGQGQNQGGSGGYNPQSYAYGQGQGQGQGRTDYNQPKEYGEESAAGWHRPSSTPGGGRGGAQNWQQAQGDDQRHGQSNTSRSTSFSSESTSDQPSAPKPVIRQSSGRWNPSDTYEDPLPPTATSPQNRSDIAGRRSPAGVGMGSPDKASGAKIDASKLGLLPKKKVDLLSSSPGGSTTNLGTGAGASVAGAEHGGVGSNANAHAVGSEYNDPNPGLPSANHNVISKIPPTPPAGARGGKGYGDSDDELEYTRNPFDEK